MQNYINLLIDLKKIKTINAEYDIQLMEKLDAKIIEKRPRLQKKKLLYIKIMHPRTHKSDNGKIARDLNYIYELLKHSYYSPDLTSLSTLM